jgi:phosphoribosylformylglycinamidine synthase
MKIAVKVRLKPGILDTQGKAVHNALEHLGFSALKDVRIGKLIELTFDDAISRAQATEMATEAAKKLLANPVIEDFELEFLEV